MSHGITLPSLQEPLGPVGHATEGNVEPSGGSTRSPLRRWIRTLLGSGPGRGPRAHRDARIAERRADEEARLLGVLVRASELERYWMERRRLSWSHRRRGLSYYQRVFDWTEGCSGLVSLLSSDDELAERVVEHDRAIATMLSAAMHAHDGLVSDRRFRLAVIEETWRLAGGDVALEDDPADEVAEHLVNGTTTDPGSIPPGSGSRHRAPSLGAVVAREVGEHVARHRRSFAGLEAALDAACRASERLDEKLHELHRG